MIRVKKVRKISNKDKQQLKRTKWIIPSLNSNKYYNNNILIASNNINIPETAKNKYDNNNIIISSNNANEPFE